MEGLSLLIVKVFLSPGFDIEKIKEGVSYKDTPSFHCPCCPFKKTNFDCSFRDKIKEKLGNYVGEDHCCKYLYKQVVKIWEAKRSKIVKLPKINT